MRGSSLPVGEEVVARQVGLVAHGDERREPEAALARGVDRRRSPARRSATGTRRGRAAGGAGRTIASRRTAGSVLMTPRQLGPTRRMPLRGRRRRARAGAGALAAPASPKPSEMTTSARTPWRAHSLPRATTLRAGIAMTASSTGSAISSRAATAVIPAIAGRRGLTACRRPANPAATMLRSTAPPIEPGRSDAPMTATDAGARTWATAAAAASPSRRRTPRAPRRPAPRACARSARRAPPDGRARSRSAEHVDHRAVARAGRTR